VAAELLTQMGQPFVVENQGGANGIVGATRREGAPDGYTLLVYSSGSSSTRRCTRACRTTPKDFTPVTNGEQWRAVLRRGEQPATEDAAGVRRLRRLESARLQHAGRRQHVAPGDGSVQPHERPEDDAHPVQGRRAGDRGAASGEVQVPTHTAPRVGSGRVRVLAFTSDKRHPAAPEVPTTAEAGLPQYRHDGGWFGMFAPANTPPDIVEKLWREVQIAEKKPAVLERFKALGVDPVADSPAEYRKFIQAEIKAYAEQARMAGIKPE
jgi:tripartite-type tricarboxylate transporter receptor subunit TctC